MQDHPDLEFGATYADRTDPMSKILNIRDAPSAASVTARTIRRWVAAGRLRVITHPRLDGRFVIEAELLACEAGRHRASRQGRPGARVRLDILT